MNSAAVWFERRVITKLSFWEVATLATIVLFSFWFMAFLIAIGL